MSYQVIARKYRPQRFFDVVGQEHVTQTLVNSIKQNRIAHAYLFVGPRGTGKTTIARIFAKCLNCSNGPTVDFSDDDPKCREISENNSLDVLEIDGASNRGIEEIRELRETIKYTPANSRFKIFIIDEVHMLTKEAFNALLKTLEEPPAHAKFMFATTEPEKVLPTILSRCQRFDLRRIPVPLIVSHLDQITRKENVEIEEAALLAIARGADGCMRDAESALDQLISFCTGKILESDVLTMFGLAARGQILDIATSILQGNVTSALQLLHSLSQSGKDLGRLLSDLQRYFRNLLIYQVSDKNRDLLDLTETEMTSLARNSGVAGDQGLMRILEVFSETEIRMGGVTSRKILMEITFLKAAQARHSMSLDAVLGKLKQLKQGTQNTATVAPPDSSSDAAKPANAREQRPQATTDTSPKPASVPEPAASNQANADSKPSQPADATGTPPRLEDDLAGAWNHLLQAIKVSNFMIHNSLVFTYPKSYTGKTLTIALPKAHENQIHIINSKDAKQVIKDKLQELGLGKPNLKFVVSEDKPAASEPTPTQAPAPAENTSAPSSPSPPETDTKPPQHEPTSSSSGTAQTPPVPNAKEDFKNDPLIKQALEIFKGHIVNAHKGNDTGA
ncbi:MAG: DNA polymerase III subunit gamma/tau [Verrucomicrobia bacterium]|nr:DNA polymerase III subunit gamma/tau [Verrucomicrobiota bacterium]MCF7708910.1 DNA polymerase III subunit gamma/tau [Verrucomicrobiota bacterium]